MEASERPLAVNLRRYRTAKGLSQGQLAEMAGLSRLGYRDIETGKAAPRSETLMRIAEALEIGIGDLLRPVRELRHVRFRAARRLTTREDVLAHAARWLDDYLELEELTGLKVDWALAGVAAKVRRNRRSQRPLDAAREARRVLGLDLDGRGATVRDICGLLEDNGVKVFTTEVSSEHFFGLSIGEKDGGPAVVVNVWPRISVERWIFSAAHELGHLLLHPEAYDVERTEEEQAEEKEADQFAGEFLMPDALFKKEWGEAAGLSFLDRVLKVKRIFHVSWQTVVYRFASTQPKRERPNVWRAFYSQYAREHGRSLERRDEPDGLTAGEFGRPAARAADEPARLDPQDFRRDRMARMVRLAVEQDAITMTRAAEVLDISLGEMRALANSWVG